MVKSIVREHKWIPSTVDNLYFDDADHFGLEFWYQDILLMNKELKDK